MDLCGSDVFARGPDAVATGRFAVAACCRTVTHCCRVVSIALGCVRSKPSPRGRGMRVSRADFRGQRGLPRGRKWRYSRKRDTDREFMVGPSRSLAGFFAPSRARLLAAAIVFVDGGPGPCSASDSETPRFSYDSSMCSACLFCLSVYLDLSP